MARAPQPLIVHGLCGTALIHLDGVRNGAVILGIVRGSKKTEGVSVDLAQLIGELRKLQTMVGG